MSESSPILLALAQPHLLLTLQYLLRQAPTPPGQPAAPVLSADLGADAILLALKHKPRLVLLHVALPDIDGYTVCQTIRDAWDGHRGQIWLIAPRSSYTERDQAVSVGADGWIVEPPDPDFILQLAAGAAVGDRGNPA